MADYTSGDQTNGTRPKRESEAPDGARLVKRYERGLERRSTVDTTQQRILEYIIPHKADITRTRTEGQERTEKVGTRPRSRPISSWRRVFRAR